MDACIISWVFSGSVLSHRRTAKGVFKWMSLDHVFIHCEKSEENEKQNDCCWTILYFYSKQVREDFNLLIFSVIHSLGSFECYQFCMYSTFDIWISDFLLNGIPFECVPTNTYIDSKYERVERIPEHWPSVLCYIFPILYLYLLHNFNCMYFKIHHLSRVFLWVLAKV